MREVGGHVLGVGLDVGFVLSELGKFVGREQVLAIFLKPSLVFRSTLAELRLEPDELRITGVAGVSRDVVAPSELYLTIWASGG